MRKLKGNTLPMYVAAISSVVKKPTPLRFTNNSDSESSVSFSDLTADIRYKLNGTGKYTQWDGSRITLQPGEYVEMVGDNQTSISNDEQHFEIDGQLAASGSVMSLVSSDKITNTIPQVDYYFAYLFYECEGLTTAPELPATELSFGCYKFMFFGCTGLKEAPELPATKLEDYCYYGMFSDATDLESVTVAFTTWLFGACQYWVENVEATGTFICPKELEKIFDESHIPTGWTVVTK